MLKTRSHSGFTLVELLIVIVVIAILAAISVISYRGIQEKAHSTAVRSDLRNFANKLEEYRIFHGAYPESNYTNAPGSGNDTVNFSISRNSYATSMHNFIYCVSDDRDRFSIVAFAKRDQRFRYDSVSGLGEHGGYVGAVRLVCDSIGYSSSNANVSFGYNRDTGVWNDWVQ